MARPSKRNAGLVLVLLAVVGGMTALSFAAVPLYSLFCRATGFGGTTQVAEAAPAARGERRFTVRFNADVDPKLSWDFAPEASSVEVRVGEPSLVFFEARNKAARPTVGAATFNVTPAKVGQYFNKVQCFCFDKQPLAPAESVAMGVSFFVDPAILDDPGVEEVRTITLSYTFFRDPEGRATDDGAMRTSALAEAGANGID